MKFLLDHDVPEDIAHLLRHWNHTATVLREVLDRTTSLAMCPVRTGCSCSSSQGETRLRINLRMTKFTAFEGFHFYEEKEKGLGDYFLSNLFAAVESLKVFGGIHRKAHRGFYPALSKRFPVAIFYTIENDTVRV